MAANGNRRRKGNSLTFEQLEKREMMAADAIVGLQNGLLTITGTTNEDRVEIYQVAGSKIGVFTQTTWASGGLGGESRNLNYFKAADVKNIRIYLGDKDDYVAIDEAFKTYRQAEIFGGKGNDVIYGGGSIDKIYGEAGHDKLYGRDGNDYLSGGTGKDYLVGGDGTDTFVRDLDDALNSTWTKAASVIRADGHLDLTGSAVASKVEDMLERLAMGNESSASVSSLSIDLDTGDVSGKFTVRHRHTWSNWAGTVVVYDDKMSGNFQYNVYSNDISGKLDLGRGVKVQLNDIYKVIQGDLTPLYTKLYATSQRNDYNAVVSNLRNTHGISKVYVASKTFVDWNGPETLVRWGGEAVASEGASLATIPSEVANKIRAEATGIANWLKSRLNDPALAQELANKIIDSLVTRKNIDTPQIEIRWQKVGYWYESNIIQSLKSQKIDHLAYAIILKI